MATVSEVRSALVSIITEAVPGLIGYPTVPDVAQLDAVVVEPDATDYQLGMGSCSDWTYCVYILVPRTETTYAQDKLDSYVSTSGVNSVPAAIRADPTLGLSGVDATLTKMDGYGGSYSTARIPHVGARLHVRVIITE